MESHRIRFHNIDSNNSRNYNYKINSQVNINIKIIVDNTNGKDSTKESKVNFIRKIKFYGNSNEELFSDEKIIFETKVITQVLPGKKQAFDMKLI